MTAPATDADAPRCPECNEAVGKRLAGDVYLCRACMKAVTVRRDDPDADPDGQGTGQGKGDLSTSTDGGREVVGVLEHVALEEGGVLLRVRTSGAGLDIHPETVEIDGLLSAPQATTDRLIAHLHPEETATAWDDDTDADGDSDRERAWSSKWRAADPDADADADHPTEVG